MEVNMRYSVDLLNRINAVMKDGKEISSCFMYGEYSLWAFQQFFLLSQIKEYTKTYDYALYYRNLKPKFSIISYIWIFVFDFLAILATCVGILSARIRKVRLVTFSSDFLGQNREPNPRLRNVYNFLHSHDVSYVEILHITNTRSFFRNLIRRAHTGIYFEALTSFTKWICGYKARKTARAFISDIDLRQFNNDERRLISLLIYKSVYQIEISKARLKIIRMVLRYLKVKIYISVDDPRYIPELLLACELEKISTHVFQHSNFDFVTGLYMLKIHEYIFPSFFYTWNTYWSRRVKEVSPYFKHNESRIVIGGRSFSPQQPPNVLPRKGVQPIPDTLTVLVPYEFSLTAKQIMPYMCAMLDDQRITVLFVLRGTIGGVGRAYQLNQYVPKEYHGNPRLVVIDPVNRAEAILKCNVIAGVYSGFLDESIETGVPVCIFNTNYLNVNRLDTDNLASVIDLGSGDIFTQLVSAYVTSDQVLEQRRQRITEGVVAIEETLRMIIQK